MNTASTPTAFTIEHLPLNPHGKFLQNFPSDLLLKEGSCIQRIEHGNFDDEIRAQLTPQALQIADDLLSVPGIKELAFYQNWFDCGREVYTLNSPTY